MCIGSTCHVCLQQPATLFFRLQIPCRHLPQKRTEYDYKNIYEAPPEVRDRVLAAHRAADKDEL